jgi:hypothetical protein
MVQALTAAMVMLQATAVMAEVRGLAAAGKVLIIINNTMKIRDIIESATAGATSAGNISTGVVA